MSNNESDYEPVSELPLIQQVFFCHGVAVSIVATLLNVWFFVAIITSRDMRSRFRNKLICSTVLAHLIDSAVVLPTHAWFIKTRPSFDCVFNSLFANLIIIQNAVVNWLLVMLIAAFIAQIKDFNPSLKFTPRVITLVTTGLLVLPWACSLVVVSIAVHYYNIKHFYSGLEDCFIPTQDSFQIFLSINLITPIILMVLLTIIAAVLRHRRLHCGNTPGSMRIELLPTQQRIENIFVYVIAIAVVAITEILDNVLLFNEYYRTLLDFDVIEKLYYSSQILTYDRALLMPLTWFIFDDVRQWMKSWRPWRLRSTDTGIDLTVTYKKEVEEN